jgi:alkaline phosphatase D
VNIFLLRQEKTLKSTEVSAFGNIVSLYMMDTRVIARDKQLEYSDYLDTAGNFDQVKFKTAFLDQIEN